MITYDSIYSILYDIAEKLGIENISNESTFSRTYSIYANGTEYPESQDTFDSIYSLAFEIYKEEGGNADAKFDSIYSICYAIYQLFGGEEPMNSFDSTYSILENVLDIIVRPSYYFYYTTTDNNPISNTWFSTAKELGYDEEKQMFYAMFSEVPTIPENIFWNNATISSAIIPEGVPSISQYAFY